MERSFVDGRLHLKRDAEERKPLIVRLCKIEGQVRGLQNMLEDDRYCLEEVYQANAIISGVREVATLIMGQHLAAGVEFAVESGTVPGALGDLLNVLRGAMRQ